MLQINLNKIAGNHVEQSLFTDNSNQYQLRSLADDKIPALILKIKQNHKATMYWLSNGGKANSGDRGVKISHHYSKQYLLASLTTVAQLH